MELTNKTTEELKLLAKEIADEIEARKPKTAKIYFHRSKDENYDDVEMLGIASRQMDNFLKCGYEICVTIEIDYDGNTYATHFCDVELPKKVLI